MRGISVNGVLSGMEEAYDIMCKRMHMTRGKNLTGSSSKGDNADSSSSRI